MEPIRLQVRDIGRSARFYAVLLGREAISDTADQAIFVTDDMRLELMPGHASVRQLDIVLGEADMIVHTYERLWDGCARLPQIPTDLGFGLGFVALDPDGNRLRVLCYNQVAAA